MGSKSLTQKSLHRHSQTNHAPKAYLFASYPRHGVWVRDEGNGDEGCTKRLCELGVSVIRDSLCFEGTLVFAIARGRRRREGFTWSGDGENDGGVWLLMATWWPERGDFVAVAHGVEKVDGCDVDGW
ncbi:uncharacterized protein HKW66_Vig0081610 [Vigna angularis]|uniref:Uncharacterized protein n=1 Tax=Phaseolus angularis TaxID=3914 RepID=A0A8T0KHH5_PHAAN|nr:uncharacterized protein HKW66_Vig0081610 [Vigna angularis]